MISRFPAGMIISRTKKKKKNIFKHLHYLIYYFWSTKPISIRSKFHSEQAEGLNEGLSVRLSHQSDYTWIIWVHVNVVYDASVTGLIHQ